MKVAAPLSTLFSFLLTTQLAAQEVVADTLASGALQNPEDEGLPWTYIVLVVVLLGVFMLLRRNRTLPSKRRDNR